MLVALLLLSLSVARADDLGACCFVEADAAFCYVVDHPTCAFAYGGSWRESRGCADPGPDCRSCADNVSATEEPCEFRECWRDDEIEPGSCARDASGYCECH